MLGFYAAYRAGGTGTASGDLERPASPRPTASLDAVAGALDGSAK